MSVLLGLLKLLGWLLKPARALLGWMLADWRNGAVVILGGFVALHMIVIDPDLREARNDAEKRAQAEADAHLDTIRNFAAASAAAEQAQAGNLARVTGEQARISERTIDDFRQRLAALHARADGMRAVGAGGSVAGGLRRAPAASGAGLSGEAGVPGIPAATGGAAATPGADGLPERLNLAALNLAALNLAEREEASVYATQLDALIGWVIAQHAVPASPGETGPVEGAAR